MDLALWQKLDNQMTLEDFAANIKSKLNIPSVRFFGESNQKIKRICNYWWFRYWI